MKCESCNTELTSETCQNCGLKQQKVMCKDCFKKFYKDYLTNGLCPECFKKEKEALYKSPGTALCLSVLPGLGHYYLGLKNKSGIYLLIFLACVGIPIIGWIMLPFAYLFPFVDAYATAKRMNVMDEYELKPDHQTL